MKITCGHNLHPLSWIYGAPAPLCAAPSGACSTSTKWPPSVNSGINLLADHLSLFFIAIYVFDLATNPVYRVQTADAASREINLLLAIGSYLLRGTIYGEAFVLLSELDQSADHLRTAYNAFEHQNESVNLAFGGVLSQLNLKALQNYSPAFDYHYHNGWFFWGAANGPLAIYNRWSSVEGVTTDRFNAQSWYRFNGVETPSGHIMTGNGRVVRERIEEHDPFRFNPILNALNFFNLNDSINMNQTTRRYESYSDSFNGAFVNQRILQNAPDLQFSLPPLEFYDQETRKRKLDVSNPPPGPPGRLPGAFSEPTGKLEEPPPVVSSKTPPSPAQPSASGHGATPGTSGPRVNRAPSQTAVSTGKQDRGGVNSEVKQSEDDFVPVNGATKKK